MAYRSRWLVVGSLGAVLVALVLLAGACAGAAAGDLPGTTQPATTPMPAPDPWIAQLGLVPYPYLLPLPESQPSVVDGIYVKLEPITGEHVPCKRCPDYVPEGGTWKLSLNRGVYHIYYPATGWRSLGSFVVAQDRTSKVEFPDKIVLFNDPYCPNVVGIYSWRREGGTLTLQAIDDTCSFRMRAANVAHLPWESCTPPTTEAGATDHWPKPAGCM